MVELLVATAVTLLLVVVLVRVFNGASGSWRHNEAQVDAYREARGALQLMARDLSATLQASYAQAGGGADPAAAVTAGPAMPTLVLEHYPGVPQPAGNLVNEEAYFLTNIHNGGASSLCAVGYFCQWMPSIPGIPTNQTPQAFALMRQSLDSNGTFLRMKPFAGSTTPLTFLNLYQRDLTGAGSGGSPPVAVPTQVAAYIWELRFRIDTDLNDGTNVSGVDHDGNNPAPYDHSTTPRRYGGGVANQPPYPPRLPPYVEIRFKALSNIAARRLEGNANMTQDTWGDPGSDLYKQIIQPNFQQFVLRVPLINATPL